MAAVLSLQPDGDVQRGRQRVGAEPGRVQPDGRMRSMSWHSRHCFTVPIQMSASSVRL